MVYTAQQLLNKIQDAFDQMDLEEDEEIKEKYLLELGRLREFVKALDDDERNYFQRMFDTIIAGTYRHHYRELLKLWERYEEESKEARLRMGQVTPNTGNQRATESSPSLGLPQQQQLQEYGSQTASRSMAAVDNVPRNPSIWRPRIFQRRDPTSDRSTHQPSLSSALGLNIGPSAERQQTHVPGNIWGGRLYHQPQRGAPTRDGRTHQFMSSNSPVPSMAPSAEQRHVPGNIWDGQQYRQPQRRAQTRDGSTHQFVPPNAPGPNMALPAEQHRTYVPQRIITQREIDQVEHQVDEEWMRRTMPAQGPGHPEMAQHAQANIFPQGQYSLPPPPRPAQRQSGFVQYEAQAQAGINAHAGPSHTRSQTVASGNTFGHELPGQPGFSAYDRRGDSLDSDSSTVSRTSYSSEGGYQSYRYRQN